MRQIVELKVSGLQTYNQYLSEVPAGALIECLNFNHDRAGILEKRRGFFLYGTTMSPSNARAETLLTYKNRVIRHFNTSLEYDDGSGTYTAFSGSFDSPDSTCTIKNLEVNSNLYITTNSGIKKLSASSSADLSTEVFRDAGGVKGLSLQGATTGVTGFLPNNSKVAYRQVWGYTDKNNNLILGSPSEIFVIENTSGTSVDVELTITIPTSITSEYFYQVYRSAYVPNTQEPEDELFLVIEDYPTSLELTDREVVITDITPDEFRTGGALLYTNAISGEGILQANEPPPLSKDITLFKNYTFYANTKTRHKLILNLLSVDDLYLNVSILYISNGTTSRDYTFTAAENIAARQILLETGGTVGFNVEETAKSIVRVLNGDSSGLVNAYYISGIDDVPGQILLESRSLTDTKFYLSLLRGSTEEFNPPLAQRQIFTSVTTGNPTIILGAPRDFDSTTDVNTGTDTITYANHYFSQGQEVKASGTLPAGLSSGTLYYINYVSANAFQLCTTKAETKKPSPTVVDITATAVGTGTFTPTHGFSTGDTVEISNSATTPVMDGTYTVTVINETSFSVPFTTTVSGTGAFNRTNVDSDNEVKPNRIYYSKLQQPEAVPIVNYIDIGPQDKAITRVLGLRDSLFVFKEDGIYRLSGTSPDTFFINLFDSSTILLAPNTAKILNNQIYALTTQGVVNVSDTGVNIISNPIKNLIDKVLLNSTYKTSSFGLTSESDRCYYLFTTTETSDTENTQAFRYNTDINSWTRWNKSNTCGVINPGDDKIYLGASDTNQLEKERKDFTREDFADREFGRTLNLAGISDNVITSLSSFTNIEEGDVIQQTQYLTFAQFNILLRKLDLDPALFDTITSITTGTTTSFFVASHAFSTGDIILFENITGSAATYLNGTHEITVTDSNNFYINVNTSIFSASGGRCKFAYNENLESSQGQDIIDRLELLANELQTYLTSAFSDSNSKVAFYGAGPGACFNSALPPSTFAEAQTVFNLIIDRLNESSEVFFSNYMLSDGTTTYEALVTEKVGLNQSLTLFTSPPFMEGPVTIYKGYESKVTWAPNHCGTPNIHKRMIDSTIIIDTQDFSNSEIRYSTDLSKGFDGTIVEAEGVGQFGQNAFGDEGFGGVASSRPIRTLTPRDKTRFRYISPQVIHINARENIRLFGLSLSVEDISQRAYKGTK